MKHLLKKAAALLCTGLLMINMSLPVSAEEEDTSPLLPSGMTVAEVEKAFDDYIRMNTGTSDDDFMGAALVGIFQGDEVLFTGFYGETDKEHGVKADENSCFEWGSITKTFIWVSALQLYEQGKIDLNKDVREYLPEDFFRHLSYDEPITMLNLMNHNAGWQETVKPIMNKDASTIGSLKDELQAVEPAQVHRPGEVTAYSNYGAGVAGYVIECITGESFCDYVHEHIFEPLGMEHTALNPTHSDNAFVFEKRSQMHSYSINSMLAHAIDKGSNTGYVGMYPAGAACGTIGDMMRYGQALVDESAPLFEHPETQELLFSATAFYGGSDIPICCHGFWPTECSVRIYGHTGGTHFGQADLEIDPVSKVGIAVMVNESSGNHFNNVTAELVFGSLGPDKYGATTYGKATDIKGYFMPARSTHVGMTRLEPYLFAINAEQFGADDMDCIGSGLLQLTQENAEDGTRAAALLGEIRTPDNRLVALQSPSNDLIPVKAYMLHLALLTAFILVGVAAVYMMLIRRKLRKAGKWETYAGAGIMTIGRIGRLLSAVLMIATFSFVVSGGIPTAASAVIGIGQMLCLAACGIAAVICIVSLLRQKEKAHTVQYLLCSGANVITVTAILFFEMYRFWAV